MFHICVICIYRPTCIIVNEVTHFATKLVLLEVVVFVAQTLVLEQWFLVHCLLNIRLWEHVKVFEVSESTGKSVLNGWCCVLVMYGFLITIIDNLKHPRLSLVELWIVTHR